MTSLIRPVLLTATLALLAATLASPLVGAAAVAPTCRDLKVVGGTVCVDPSLACPSAWYVPPFTDFGAGARHCVTASVGPASAGACHEIVAGYWSFGGFFGVNERTCASYVQHADGSTCVYASGNSWMLVPVCLP